MMRVGIGLLVIVLCVSMFGVCVSIAAERDDTTVWGFVKSIFVPSPDYFQTKMAVINEKLKTKLGGVAYLYLMIEHFLTTLDSVPSADLAFTIPAGFWGSGSPGFSYRFDAPATRPYIRVVRDVSTASYILMIAVWLYHKVRTFFEG